MFLSKYGVARHIYIPMVKRGVVDHAVSADWTPAAGDVKISKDGGAAANVTNLPSAIAMGNSTIWDFSITATEMQAAQIMITIADTATKAVEDSAFIIETYGNASGQHPFDLATATQSVNVSSINSVSASSVTTINANQGTTQPLNFTGTGASALVKGDAVDIAGAAVSTSSAQIGVNVIQAAGTAWGSGAITAASIAADAITAAKIADAAIDAATFAAGAINAAAIAADAITAAKIADGAIDAATFAAGAINAAAIAADAITDAKVAADVTIASVTGSVGSVTGAVGSVTGAVGSVTGNVGGSVGSVTGNVGGNVVGSVASVTGNVGGNVVGSVASVTATVNADVKKINGTTVNGDGSLTPWGP